MPLSKTIRTAGAPDGVAVAKAMALASLGSVVLAVSNQRPKSSKGSVACSISIRFTPCGPVWPPAENAEESTPSFGLYRISTRALHGSDHVGSLCDTAGRPRGQPRRDQAVLPQTRQGLSSGSPSRQSSQSTPVQGYQFRL